MQLFTPRTLKAGYVRRYGETRRVRAWRRRRVHVRTDKGVWREAARGYTDAGAPDAMVTSFDEGLRTIRDLGPEKRAALVLADGGPDIP